MDINVLPEYLTCEVTFCDPEYCECGQVAVDAPGNGPFGAPFKGFKLWTEFFPS